MGEDKAVYIILEFQEKKTKIYVLTIALLFHEAISFKHLSLK